MIRSTASREFDLEPYPAMPVPAGVRVAGSARRDGPLLEVNWRLEAPAGSVAIAELAASPERRFGLWEATCFECFIAAEGRPGYWELNLSPAGHWNLFRFEGYRDQMADESAVEALPFERSDRPGVCAVSARLDTTRLGLAAASWRLGVSTVVVEPSGRTSLWALSHPGAEADFHHPDSLRIALQGG